MNSQRNNSLITKVLLIGIVIAVLSYLFHPDAGHILVSFNGQPVADPLVRFAAIPSFLVVLCLTGLLMLLLFLGVGIMMFMGALLFSLGLDVFIVPYFWPVLVIIFLIIMITSVNHHPKDRC